MLAVADLKAVNIVARQPKNDQNREIRTYQGWEKEKKMFFFYIKKRVHHIASKRFMFQILAKGIYGIYEQKSFRKPYNVFIDFCNRMAESLSHIDNLRAIGQRHANEEAWVFCYREFIVWIQANTYLLSTK